MMKIEQDGALIFMNIIISFHQFPPCSLKTCQKNMNARVNTMYTIILFFASQVMFYTDKTYISETVTDFNDSRTFDCLSRRAKSGERERKPRLDFDTRHSGYYPSTRAHDRSIMNGNTLKTASIPPMVRFLRVFLFLFRLTIVTHS